jgi:excisionase family DNA binding protein
MNKSDTANGEFFTPKRTAARWHWHTESVRRKIRRGEIGSVAIGRRRLIPFSEIERVEREGFVPAKA